MFLSLIRYVSILMLCVSFIVNQYIIVYLYHFISMSIYIYTRHTTYALALVISQPFSHPPSDSPTESENFPIPRLYIHRIGRSGRFGRKGVAINFARAAQLGSIQLGGWSCELSKIDDGENYFMSPMWVFD